MRTFHFSLVAVLALAIAFPSFAAEKPRATQSNPSTQAKKVWTNEDMDELRARGLITTFNPAIEMIIPTPTVAPEPARFASKTEDPPWYPEHAFILHLDLDKREAPLPQPQQNLPLPHHLT